MPGLTLLTNSSLYHPLTSFLLSSLKKRFVVTRIFFQKLVLYMFERPRALPRGVAHDWRHYGVLGSRTESLEGLAP